MITLQPSRGKDGDVSPWLKTDLSPSGLSRFVRAAKQAVGLEGDVHVLLADDATLRKLNRRFLGKDKATDVLSFPVSDDVSGEAASVAGDLAISLDAAARQAARFGHSLRDEVRVLMLHGMLHLAGFDHEADRGEMATREAELRRELKLPATLIERTGSARAGSAQRRARA